jgi:hypothetical protein
MTYFYYVLIIQQVADNDVGLNLIVPEVGMSFESEEKAYDMYNTYAGKIGFIIRKSDIKRRGDGSISHKHIVCSSQGHSQTESSKDTTRTGCNARVQFSVSKEGVWTVYKVVLDHNHYLASPNKRQKLRSQRSVQEADKKLISQMREGGMKPAQVFEFMVQFYGGADKVPFSWMDCNNEIGRQRKKYLEANDTKTLMDYLKNKQIEDPSFFYAVDIDEEDGRMINFFGQMVSLSWITHVLVTLCLLTPRFRLISLNCLLLHYWEPTITNRQSFLGQHYCLMRPLNLLFGYFKPFWKQCQASILVQFLLIKMRPWQVQYLMYSQTQAIVFVYGTFI